MRRSKRQTTEDYTERAKYRLRRLNSTDSPLAEADPAAVEMRLRNLTYGRRTRS